MYTIFVVKVTQQEVNLTSLNNFAWDLVHFLIKLRYCFSNLHGKSSDFHTHMGDSYDSLPPPIPSWRGHGPMPLGAPLCKTINFLGRDGREKGR